MNRDLVLVWQALGAANLLGLLVRDIAPSGDEIEGLSGDLLVSKSGEPPPGKTRLSDRLDGNPRTWRSHPKPAYPRLPAQRV